MVELGTRGAIERAPVGNSPPAAARTVFLPDQALRRRYRPTHRRSPHEQPALRAGTIW